MSSAFEYQGFDVVSPWNGALVSSNAAIAFSAIAAAGSNSVGLSPKLLVNSGTSSQLVTDAVQTTSDTNLIAGIRAAQAKGLKVLLEPHLQALDGTSSSQVNPTDPSGFFASYKAAIVHLATIAQRTGVDTLSIGNEMGRLSGGAYRTQWLDIIAAVRQVYTGKLTYEAATYEASSVSFWDKVDTIGLNAYLTLSASKDPTVGDLEQAWTAPPADNYTAKALNGLSLVDFMHSLATTYGKHVLVTEVGYRSIDGAATNPGQWSAAGTADTADQTNAYQALFQVMQAQGGSWFAGLNLWQYSIDATDSATNYDLGGKPALALVQQYFSGHGAVAGLALDGSSVGDLIDIGSGNDTINAGLGNDMIRSGAGDDVIVAGPAQILRSKTTTVTITGYGALGTTGSGSAVALLINGQQVGATAVFTPAADPSDYQTYTLTFDNPDQINSMDLALLNRSSGGAAMIRSITLNGASLAPADVTNASAPGTFNLYANSIHLDASTHQQMFFGAQSDNDSIQGGAGNDTIDGGAGLDTAIYQGPLGAYSFAKSGNSLIVKDSVPSRDGQDTLVNVEYLQFANQSIAVASLLVPDLGTTTISSLMSPLLSGASVVASTGAPATARILANGVTVANATVTLWNGSSRLASTTANASGAYSFSLANQAPGTYTLSTKASLGSLQSPASNSACLIIASSTTIVAQLAALAAPPQSVYITDPAGPIIVSVAQLHAVSPSLAQAVTPYALTLSDTASNVLASLDSLAVQVNLSAINLTGSHVFNVTQPAMLQVIAADSTVLAKIQGGYSFAVASVTANGAARTTRYDSTGTMTSVQTVTVSGGTTETFVSYATGFTSDTYTDASGAVLNQTVIDATGKHYTTNTITGKPYTSGTYNYNTAGQLTSYTENYANGVVYDTRTTGTDGTVTTLTYGTTGSLTQQVVVTTSGTTRTTVYAASGAKASETLLGPAGRQFTQYNITGKPYTSGTYNYNTAGQLTSYSEYYASGMTYDTRTTGPDGSVTTLTYGTTGSLTQKVVVTTSGTTDTTVYAASGAKATETLLTPAGKQFSQYGITGKPYTSGTYIYNTAGQLTGYTEYYANGSIYDTRTTGPDGTVTTLTYDTSGHLTQQAVVKGNNAAAVTKFTPNAVSTAASPTAPVAAFAPNGLTLSLSEDAYQGDAHFTVSVDGRQIGGEQVVTALHGRGQNQYFTFDDHFDSGQHQVLISFLNDRYGGTPTLDRNLYINSISLDGATSVVNTMQGQTGRAQYIVQAGSQATSSAAQLDIAAGTTLILEDASAGSTVSFHGANGTLQLSSPQDFHGAVSAFAASDTIDLRAMNFGDLTTFTYREATDGGVLSVSDGTHAVGLDLNGQYTSSNFKLASDGFGGTAVTLLHHP